MATFETDATVGPGGTLTLNHLPFAHGATVHVRVEQHREEASPASRVLGLHPGSVWMSDDFDAPLPERFWLGEDEDHEASS